MGKRLYVGNLPYDADEETIRVAFSEGGGTVERVHIPLDRETQRPRGFAFVEMASDEDAKAALVAMDGAAMGSRRLRVSEAEDRRPGSGGPGGGGFAGPRSDGAPRAERPVRPARPEPSAARPRDAGPVARESVDAGRDSRAPRFGPDSKPLRERERERERERRGSRKRPGDEEGDFHGRRGGNRFDDDDDE